MRVAFTLDPAADVPLHRQIYEEWRHGILTGRFRRGERVPSTRELASTLAVARTTVSAAYDQLMAEGYLDSVRGSGTFVCRELPDELVRPRRTPAPRAQAETPIRLSRYGAGLPETRFCYEPRRAGWLRFSEWRPDLNEFPFTIWRKLMVRQLRGPDSRLFDYADTATGYGPLCEEIAGYLARSRAVSCTADQVLIVNGSQQALDLCARLLVDPGDEVAFENPGYQGARQVFAACGARLAPAHLDQEGLAASALSERARLVYCTPSHQFPTGVSMPVTRRLELIEWARRRGAAIIEDDYDSEYRYSGPPMPSMQGLAGGAPVLYIGTFSKVMFPGLRIGYVIVPPKLAPAFARGKWLTDRQTPLLEQAALADFLREGHLERHIRRMRRLYGRRRAVLVEALAKHFGDRATVLGDDAGMHVLVRFHNTSVVERAHANKVILTASAPYYLGTAPKDEFVFGFSSLTERAIREGIRRLV
uniref:Transcriptional regulator, GntR family n=1 Tax=Solibacter usitatus (strain Ellin6076) TaxID=234267 RepID=Q01X53_SOLUE